VNVAIEVKLYLDICDTDIDVLNVRSRLLKFYDQISTHNDFINIDKSDFKELKECYQNMHDAAFKKHKQILKKCFTSIETSSKKRQTLKFTESTEDDDEKLADSE